jgi:hypothetical protein
MTVIRRVIDYTNSDSVIDAPELPLALICIKRALLLAEVPGIRCTNNLKGEQKFELAEGTPVSFYLDKLIQKARNGEPIPTPRQVLTLFGSPCFSTLPCGAPVPIFNECPSTLNASSTNEKGIAGNE